MPDEEQRTDERDEEYTVTLHIPALALTQAGVFKDWFVCHNPGMELVEVVLTFHEDAST